VDADRFDALSRALSLASSRWAIFTLLTGGALGGLRGAVGLVRTGADRGCRPSGNRDGTTAEQR
jgi:hypothetical protein